MSLPMQTINHHSSSPRIAVLLNGNAKRVKPSLVKRLAKYVPSEDIYYSNTLEEGEEFCRTIYQKGYDMVFTGGGDGTLLQCVTQLRKSQSEDPNPHKLPAVGVLKLGTGNAVASLLGAHSGITQDLVRAKKKGQVKTRLQHWVSVLGQEAPFAGIGYDSLILHHYRQLKTWLAGTPFSWLGKGSLGYFFSIAGRSIPSSLFKKKTEVTIINEGDEPAYLIGSDGRYVKEFQPGEVMFSGATTLVGASTVSCFGFKFKMFPFAESGEHMHLRVSTISSIETVMNLRSIWRGEYRSPKVYDFHASKVRVISKEPEPLQIGGDASGLHKEVVFALSEKATQLADFTKEEKQPALSFPRPQLGAHSK